MFNATSNEHAVTDLLDKIEKLAYEKGRLDAISAAAAKNNFAVRIAGGVLIYFAVAFTVDYAQTVIAAHKAKAKQDIEPEATKA